MQNFFRVLIFLVGCNLQILSATPPLYEDNERIFNKFEFRNPEFIFIDLNPIVKVLVTEAYQAVLGRSPDVTGLAQWQAIALEFGISEVVSGLSDSTEGIVVANYRQHCLRDPSLDERSSWINFIESNKFSREDVENQIKNSDESFIGNAYRKLLGRNPDTEGYNAWVQFRRKYGDAAVLNGLRNSGESTSNSISLKLGS